MSNYKERFVKNIEFSSAALIGLGELARSAGQIWRMQAISTGTEFDAINPVVNFLLDYTGDFSLGFMFTWGIRNFIPRVSDQVKSDIATGVVLGTGIALETLPIPGAHTEDIGALLVGITTYRGLHWGLNRLLKTENRSQKRNR